MKKLYELSSRDVSLIKTCLRLMIGGMDPDNSRGIGMYQGLIDYLSDKPTKRKPLLQRINLEGNNGGDYISIHEVKKVNGDSVVNIATGHCCVTDFAHTLPTEVLTAALHHAYREFEGDPMKILTSVGWSEEQAKEIMDKRR
jgi:hypothetical protein